MDNEEFEQYINESLGLEQEKNEWEEQETFDKLYGDSSRNYDDGSYDKSIFLTVDYTN